MSSMGGVIQDIWPRYNILTYIGHKPAAIMKTYTYKGCYLGEQETTNSISLVTKLGLFWGVTTTITITSLHEALCDNSLPFTTPARTRRHCDHCDHGDHAHCLSRQSRTPSLAATTNVVSRGSHVRRLSRRSRTSSLEAIRYVVSRDDRVRCLSR